MPIEIEIRTSEEDKDIVNLDGHLLYLDNVKRADILDMLEYMGYITIKVTEE